MVGGNSGVRMGLNLKAGLTYWKVVCIALDFVKSALGGSAQNFKELRILESVFLHPYEDLWGC